MKRIKTKTTLAICFLAMLMLLTTINSATNVLSAKKPRIPPPAPTLSMDSVDPDVDGTIDLSWTSSIGATSYTVFRDISPITEYNAALTEVYVGISTSCQDIGLEEDIYYYIVIASNRYGDSPISNNVDITVEFPTPVFPYSTFVGGTYGDEPYAIAIDDFGCAYITGSTYSDDFPTTSGAYSETFNGEHDIFVCKLSADGSQLEYSTYIGGSARDYGYDIIVDDSGCVYICGRTYSDDFPTTAGAIDETHNGESDAFVCKLSADGSQLEYSTLLGGDNFDHAFALLMDNSNCLYVIGDAQSPNFPTTVGAYDDTHNGLSDVFVCKFSADGSQLEYSTLLGGSNYDSASAMVIDSENCVYITGSTQSPEFPTTAGAYDEIYDGSYDIFITKLSADCSQLEYSTLIGTSSSECANDIAIDQSNCVYITGWTMSSSFPITTGVLDSTFNGGYTDTVVCKVNADGSDLIYSTFIGGSNIDQGFGITIDSAGYAYITGNTQSTNYPAFPPALQGGLRGPYDIFISKVSPDASHLIYSSYYGGSGPDRVRRGHVMDDSNILYIAGYTDSVDFPMDLGDTPGYDETFNGITDAFVLKYESLP